MRKVGNIYGWIALVLGVVLGAGNAAGQQSSEELAKALANPIAALISVPFDFNYNGGYGTEDGDQLLVNIQPVVPISLSEDWNLISRTILPVIWQNDIAGNSGSQGGLGDTLQSFFFSPAAVLDTGLGNLTWGVGPALAIPTADAGGRRFGSRKERDSTARIRGHAHGAARAECAAWTAPQGTIAGHGHGRGPGMMGGHMGMP